MYPRHPVPPLAVSFGPLLQDYWLPPEVHFPGTKGEATLRIVGTPPGRLSCLQPNGRCVLLPRPATTHSLRSVVPRMRPCAGRGTLWGWFSPGFPTPYDHLNCGSPEHAGLREQIPLRLRVTVEALYSQPALFSDLPGAVTTLVQTARPSQYSTTGSGLL